METLTWYHFNEYGYYYLSTVTNELEACPRGATLMPVPTLSAEETARFVGTKWVVVAKV